MLALSVFVAFAFNVTSAECRTLGPGQQNPLRAQLVLTGEVENAADFTSLPESLVSVQLGKDCEQLMAEFPVVAGDVLRFEGDMWESGAGHHGLNGNVQAEGRTLDVEAYWED